MEYKLYQINGQQEEGCSLIAEFMNEPTVRQAAILLAGANVFDYQIRRRNKIETIRSYRRVLCPGCGAEWTYSELKYRENFGHKLCDCNVQFLIPDHSNNLQFNGEVASPYIP